MSKCALAKGKAASKTETKACIKVLLYKNSKQQEYSYSCVYQAQIDNFIYIIWSS